MPDPASLVACSSGGRRLRLDFTWRGDRYMQTLYVGDGAGAETLAWISVEGAADEAWPGSPAFQQLHVESRGERRVALLVGMAGTSHWSASVEPVEGRAAWLFDVACRVREAPSFLGSEYRFAQPEVGACLALQPEPPAVLFATDGERRGVAAERQAPRFPTTLRWRYVVSADDDRDA